MDRRTLVTGLITTAVLPPLQWPAIAQSARGVNDIIKSLAPIDGQIAARDRHLTLEPITVEQRTVYVDTTRQIDLEVYFEYDSARITQRARTTLEDLGLALESPALSAFAYLVAGHTDASGTDAYNVALSQRRARAVEEHLVSNYAIELDRLMSVGFGFRRLKDPLRPRAAINRRVEILLIVP